MNAIGFVELNSIAKGYEVADIAVKTSNVELLTCNAGCPGKFYILFSGDVAAVKASMDSVHELGTANIVDSTVISNLHDDVIKAMSMTTEPVHKGALGVMEFFSVTASVYAADAAIKASDISLVGIRTGIGIGGKSYVTLMGTVSAVEAAVKAGISSENAQGMLINSAVIPNPDEELIKSLY